MRPRKRAKKSAKQSFDIEKLIIVAAVTAIFMLLPLFKTGLPREIAGFFSASAKGTDASFGAKGGSASGGDIFSGYFKTQVALAEHCGKMISGFADKLVADAGQSVGILGAAHGRLIAQMSMKPVSGVETPFDAAVGVFAEAGYMVRGFAAGMAENFTVAFNDVGESLYFASLNWDHQAELAQYHAAKGVTDAGGFLANLYPAVFAETR